MQTHTKLRIKQALLALTMFACISIPLWIVLSLLLDLKEVIETNPLAKIPVAAAVFAIFLGYIKHKTGYELKSSIVNVNVIGGNHD